MICWRRARVFVMACSVLFLVVTAGCAPKDTDQQQKEREDKTRDDAAKATERAKPEIQEAGRELGRAADEAAREARAFAEGVRQGWLQGGHPIVNVNAASETDLMELPDISPTTARTLTRNRPSHDREDLRAKRVMS